MNDIAYMLKEDTREKKQTANGAKHRASRTGKGAVKLPSDYMTKKEIRKMNGECKTYNINTTMTWKTFLNMPTDIQIEYIRKLQSKFDMTQKALAEMFGTKQKSVNEKLRTIGIKFGSPKKGYQDRDRIFLEWADTFKTSRKQEANDFMKRDCTAKPFSYCEKKNDIYPNHGHIDFDSIKVKDLIDYLKSFLSDDTEYRITLHFGKPYDKNREEVIF